jgi:microcystin-dependent protein
MAIQTKHHFVSAKGDGSDATLVRPSNWNENHDITLAANNIIGRLSAGPGAAEEIPLTAYAATLLNMTFAQLAVALGLPTTGDCKLTYKGAADPGWVMMDDGTIGNTGSGASNRANADTQALFTFFYNYGASYDTTWIPIFTSTGAATTRAAQGTAAAAFAANCRLMLPRQLGRTFVIAPGFAGNIGAGLSQRFMGTYGGEENHTLTQAEAPDHLHNVSSSGSGTGTGSGSASVSGSFSGNTGNVSADHSHFTSSSGTSGAADRDLNHQHSNPNACSNVSSTGGGQFATGFQTNTNTGFMDRSIDHLHSLSVAGTSGGISANHTHGFSGSVNSSGSCSVSSISVSVSVSGTTAGAQGYGNQPHNNMQPWTAISIMVKL